MRYFVILFVGLFFLVGCQPSPEELSLTEQNYKLAVENHDVDAALNALTYLAKFDSEYKRQLAYTYIYEDSHRDIKKAMKLLQNLSDIGDADAKEAIAGLYYEGKYVQQDYGAAASWYLDYLEHERDPDVLTRISMMQATGTGFFQDKFTAYFLAREAVNKKYVPAVLVMNEIFASMSVDEQYNVRQTIENQKKSQRR